VPRWKRRSSTSEDDGIRDFIAWGFRTGMRKGEIARLIWNMLDRSGTPWVLRIPAAITKNRTGRTLGLEGEVRAKRAQLREIRGAGDGKPLKGLAGVGSSGRIRTEDQPSTPHDPEQLDLDLSARQSRPLSDAFGPIRTEKRDS
jgi:hypothetical protein